MRATQRPAAVPKRTTNRNKTVGIWQNLRWASLPAAAVLLAGLSVLGPATPALAQGSAPGAPGANATWNESNVQGFADSLGAPSKVWYTLGDGELENVFYPQTDTPDTFGLQYIVTDGSAFTDTETANTSHTVSLVDPTSLVWQQVNTATNGDFKITKTYIADPSRSVVLVQTTFDNLSSTPLQLYADYLPQLNNDGNFNSDRAPGDSRNSLRLPAFATGDLRLSKEVPLGTERIRARFIAEAFNFTNRTNVTGRNATRYNFTLPSATNLNFVAAPNAVFGAPTSAGDPRIFQLALKFTF